MRLNKNPKCRRLNNLEGITDVLMDDLYKKYYGPRAMNNWSMKLVYGLEDCRGFIKIKLQNGYNVKCGYSATSVRGYHNHWIFWK